MNYHDRSNAQSNGDKLNWVGINETEEGESVLGKVMEQTVVWKPNHEMHSELLDLFNATSLNKFFIKR